MKTLAALTPITTIAALLAPLLTACTQQLPSEFLLEQQLQSFAATKKNISTKIDMLWVVDNSSSMDPIQAKLRTAFTSFAKTYMQPTWDIRVAAIPTDAYLANPVFNGYLASTIAESANADDTAYLSPLVARGVLAEPADQSWWNVALSTLMNLLNGDFSSSGVTINELKPYWGPSYAKLLPGLHAGPVAGLCSSFLPYFLNGENQCATRDDPQNAHYHTGTANCLNPASGETGITQCVNTVYNDTVHTGAPIISTLLPAGQNAATWTQTLNDDFLINLTTGTAGMGTERGLGSVLQMLNDNETSGSASALFRPGSLRVIVFISDEDDQTLLYSPSDAANPDFGAWTHYHCDQAGLLAMNSGNGQNISGSGGFCCSDGTCMFGSDDDGSAPTDSLTCPSKTIPMSDDPSDGTYTYTISTCPNPSASPFASRLVDVSDVKTQLDSFFNTLDGDAGGKPGYFIVTITGLYGQSIQSLQTQHTLDDSAAGAPAQNMADRGDRYIDLGNLVGNGSFSSDITATDYTAILTDIGNEIVQQEGTFTLNFPTSNQADMIVAVQHSNGTATTLADSQYTVSGDVLTITDLNLVLTFLPTDQISINYQPSSSYN